MKGAGLKIPPLAGFFVLRTITSMGRLRIFIILAVAFVFAFMAYSIIKEKRVYEASVHMLQAKKAGLESENANLSAKIEYFKNPQNLLKEARTQFNFVGPGEKVIIIIPENTGTSSSPDH